MTLPVNQGQPRIPLGNGAITYGGRAVRGKERNVQYIEHNEGQRPTMGFAAAEHMPIVAQDHGLDGAGICFFGGSVMAQAYVDAAGVVTPVPGGLALANGGVAHAISYGSFSAGACEDIDNLGTVLAAARAVTTNKSGANKPIGVVPQNTYSQAMDKINRNFKVQKNTMITCDYFVEMPADNIFMSGGTLPMAAIIERSYYGVADHQLDLESDVTLKGLQTGDCVVSNPYLPGSVISITDLEAVVAARGATGADTIAVALEALWGGTRASASYVADQKVAKVELSQIFMIVKKNAAGVVEIVARDQYAEALNTVTTATGFGLSGKDSGGVGSHLHTAFSYSESVANAGAAGVNVNVKTIWLNLQF